MEINEKAGSKATYLLVRYPGKDRVQLVGCPAVVAKTICLIGDVVWPGWQSDARGRESYMHYCEGCEDGEIICGRECFFDVAWPIVKKHLELDGHPILELPED